MSPRLSICLSLALLLLACPFPVFAAGAGLPLAYRVLPDLRSCQAGQLDQATSAQVLSLINRLRALHGLAPLAYAPALQDQADAAALAMAANGTLSHSPAPGWRCVSALAQKGARGSLLYGGTVSSQPIEVDADDIVASWLGDADNVQANGLGHRRWLLDPFLQRVAFSWVAGRLGSGAWSGAAALRLGRGRSATPPRGGADFVAWPSGDYPARYFDPRAWLSFSVLVDPTRPGANRDVDYRQARVRVIGPDGRMLPVLGQREDNEDFGLPNNLQFRVAGLRPGVRYQVQVDGVAVAGVPRVFRYGFRVASSRALAWPGEAGG